MPYIAYEDMPNHFPSLDRDVIARAICEPGMLGHYDSKSGSKMRWRCQQIADRVIAAIHNPAQSSQIRQENDDVFPGFRGNNDSG